MGALPKKKISKSARGRRRSHLALRQANLVECPECHNLRLPHHVCPACGTYKGVEFFEVETR
jgi:large subunit ribosomal protein L32